MKKFAFWLLLVGGLLAWGRYSYHITVADGLAKMKADQTEILALRAQENEMLQFTIQ